jgi:DNA-binding winged helix-turn-helix (wHTH) protein
VLAVLLDSHGRVIGRREIARRAGMSDLHDRRCDSVLVQLRRQLGASSIVTVRRRGWMLAGHALEPARHLFAHLAGHGELEFDERGERAS